MLTDRSKLLEARLKRLSYPEIEHALVNVTAQGLIELLDSKSIKIGDSAGGLIRGEKSFNLLISSILHKELITKLGKIRATNILFPTGRRYPSALKAYLALLDDADDEIAHNALLALVYWGDRQVIPAIKHRAKCVKSPKDAKDFIRACEALEKCDPHSFNPSFIDNSGIWKY